MSGERKTFFDAWWLTLPLALLGLIGLLLLDIRWIIDGGLRHVAGNTLLWLSLGVGLLLWALLPGGLYLAGARPDDARSQRLIAAWQRSMEIRDWLALPIELFMAVVRWGALIAAVACAAWFLIAGDDSGLRDPDWAVPAAIRFALFLLLYLNLIAIAGLIAGLWTLFRRENPESDPITQRHPHSKRNEV